LKRRDILLIGILALALSLPTIGHSATYPDKLIKLVVPFGAGGETDIVARLLAVEIQNLLGQTVVVQNIVGASGMIGCRTIATAKPDGYTLGVIPAAPLAMHPHMREVPYTIDSFDYIGRIIKSPYMVLVRKDSPWNTMADMITDMKAKPGAYYWASAGVGSVPYFAGLEIMTRFDLDVKHVPFTGDADALQAMAGDRVQIYTSTAGALEKFDVKALAILNREPSLFHPEVPSISKYGQEIFISQWMPLVAPKGLPPEVLSTLEKALKTVCNSENFRNTMSKMGLGIEYLDPAETEKFIRAESERNKKNIASLKEK
jgi:tripartite-type tricarboxylate transporter receptor subunit TctC